MPYSKHTEKARQFVKRKTLTLGSLVLPWLFIIYAIIQSYKPEMLASNPSQMFAVFAIFLYPVSYLIFVVQSRRHLAKGHPASALYWYQFPRLHAWSIVGILLLSGMGIV
ncbi:hypothetical protein [Pelagibaculum spongiae]|uniref:Uncharacterized protein n=1 Tax=Pelagibaculum spongiae TaxID=2080658 RepID=A0A2V1GYZ7_9GAMM|nr:hypothetical protein [Pelagibaculum spongiae]PVZ66359.1 hypothetical protein DC094_16815 [Pelagibaculum spongiae]